MGARIRANAVLAVGLLSSCAGDPSVGGGWGEEGDETGGIVVSTTTGDEERPHEEDTSGGDAGTSSSSHVEAEGSSSDSSTGIPELEDETGEPRYPVAEDDRYIVTVDRVPLEVTAETGVLANDEAGEGPLEVTAFQSSTRSGGTAYVAPDGRFSYMPAEGFIGEDRFTYTVTDLGLGESDMGSVRIIVLEPS